MKSLLKLFLFLILTPSIVFSADPSLTLSCTTDWQSEVEIAKRKGAPILVVFSSDSCMPCEQLKSELIEPMLTDGTVNRRVHITEFSINQGGKVTDFDGELVRSRMFVRRYNVFATPTVLLLEYNGEILSAPLVGYDASDDYSKRLNSAIADATMNLAGKTSPRFAHLPPSSVSN